MNLTETKLRLHWKIGAVTFLFFGYILSNQLLRAQNSAHNQKPYIHRDSTAFFVGPYDIVMPEGAYLLIRKGNQVGAVRFTNVIDEIEACRGTADYESYFQADGTGSFVESNVLKKTGKIDLKPTMLQGRFKRLQFSGYQVHIGPWTFASDCPSNLTMYLAGKSEKDYGFELAPTSAMNVSEIDASDKRLQWFRYFDDKSIKLLVSELPK
jgi:hypothetical protein